MDDRNWTMCIGIHVLHGHARLEHAHELRDPTSTSPAESIEICDCVSGDGGLISAGSQGSLKHRGECAHHRHTRSSEHSCSQGKGTSVIENEATSSDCSHSHVCLKLRVPPVDAVLASCFVCELLRSHTYRQTFARSIFKASSSHRRRTVAHQEHPHIHLRVVLRVTESKIFTMEPDIRWSKKMLPLWLVRISMDDAFSWLSTLGGAYSALGDDFNHFAEKAGQVSIHQMKLALKMGDPILQARCKVYMAQSFLQKGFFQLAISIIKQQYKFALSLGECTDQRLINMCMGVWSMLQHVHRQKLQQRKQDVGLRRQDGDEQMVIR